MADPTAAAQPPITLYTSAICGYCVAAKNFLRSRGLQWDEVRIDLDPAERERMVARTRRTSVPQMLHRNVNRTRRSSPGSGGAGTGRAKPPSIFEPTNSRTAANTSATAMRAMLAPPKTARSTVAAVMGPAYGRPWWPAEPGDDRP